MATYYLDTSALAKRYITETGQGWKRRLTMPRANNGLLLSQFGVVELEVAISRKVSEGVLSLRGRDRALSLFQRHLRGRYDAMPVHKELLKRARQLVGQRGLPHPLRAYDAIHLASALEVRDRLQHLGLPAPIFVSADRKLLAVAQHLGLAIENPEDHP